MRPTRKPLSLALLSLLAACAGSPPPAEQPGAARPDRPQASYPDDSGATSMKVAGGAEPAPAATPAVGELSQREPVGQPYSTRQCPGSPDASAAAPTAATAYHISCVSLYKATQRDVFKVHETTTDEAVRETAAAILSELWHEHLLERSIKDALVDRYYRPVLRQLHYPGRLVLDMQIQTSFPFPTNWIELRPGRRRNGALEAEETNPVRNDNMSLNGPTMRLLQPSMSAPPQWRSVLRTNPVVVR